MSEQQSPEPPAAAPNRSAGARRLTLGSLLAAAAVLILLWVAGAAGIFAGSRQDRGPGTAPLAAGKGDFGPGTGLTRWAPADRRNAPPLEGVTLSGQPLTLAGMRGRVVVINIWGSWCAPCRAEAPDLRRVSVETRAAGVRFLGIDTRDNPAAARAFVREFRLDYPSLVDDDGRLLLAFQGTVPAQAVPSTVLVDRQGRIAARVIGRVTYSTLRGLVDDLAREDLGASSEPG